MVTSKAIKQAAWTYYRVWLSGLYVELVMARKMRLSEAVKEFLIEG